MRQNELDSCEEIHFYLTADGVKMSADEARNTRYGTLNTTLEKGSKLKNNISDKIDRSTGFFENVKDLNTIDIGRWN